MNRNKHFKSGSLYTPKRITPNEVRFILSEIGMNWPTSKVNNEGWVLINSPFREDKHPSFSLDINSGGFIDFARPDVKGDLVTLVMHATGRDWKQAKTWILSLLNYNLKSLQNK